jgi:hypothetical protein
MSTSTQHDLEQLLDQAIASLQEAIHEIAEVRDVLQRVRRERGSASVTLLRDLRQDLIDLGTPLHFGSRYLYDAIQSLAAQIGASPTEPEYVLWLTGVDWQRPILNEQRRQYAAALQQWLEPYLDRVSARTRTALMRCLEQGMTATAPADFATEAVLRLTPEAFLHQLQKPNGGYVAALPGLGPKGLAELRRVLKVQVRDKE